MARSCRGRLCCEDTFTDKSSSQWFTLKNSLVLSVQTNSLSPALHPEGSVMSAGFFELKASEPLVYTYTYDEMKVVIKGEFILTDQATGETTRATERDVLFFPKGTTVKFETPDYALGFFTGDRTFAP
ncbi:cupin domain-containing protein [Cryobacterium sp. PH31-O1]|uniref:cupin domain-containing protein n=1 Tax=Cryobacterium sp. PH31-O1 TaxID=3046306 RepID=UPI0024B95F9B|nr:cupin domain-containing protein [Cryobacterium sp. PH31-O1]MDJ0339061.1 cupin domain-containing protein [Cryobacterium sp. PH31-O1]